MPRASTRAPSSTPEQHHRAHESEESEATHRVGERIHRLQSAIEVDADPLPFSLADFMAAETCSGTAVRWSAALSR